MRTPTDARFANPTRTELHWNSTTRFCYLRSRGAWPLQEGPHLRFAAGLGGVQPVALCPNRNINHGFVIDSCIAAFGISRCRCEHFDEPGGIIRPILLKEDSRLRTVGLSVLMEIFSTKGHDERLKFGCNFVSKAYCSVNWSAGFASN